MAINKNSNLYTIIYTIVMVAITGALLATLSTSLKDEQDANVLAEQKNSIMKAFGDANGNFEDVTVYSLKQVVNEDKTVTFERVAVESDADIKDVFKLISNRKQLTDIQDNLPYFEYVKDNNTMYVIPIVGKGLWGDIWGYVAVENNVENGWQVAGIVMDHAGETPGLGAEIATEGVQNSFKGKRLFNGGEFALRMQKGGAKPGMENFQVDAITGGTKTCDGVNAMLETSLMKYESLFN